MAILDRRIENGRERERPPSGLYILALLAAFPLLVPFLVELACFHRSFALSTFRSTVVRSSGGPGALPISANLRDCSTAICSASSKGESFSAIYELVSVFENSLSDRYQAGKEVPLLAWTLHAC